MISTFLSSSPVTRHLRPCALADTYVSGDLLRRAIRNLERLEGPEYRPPAVFQSSDYPWPADMEGRTLLALSLLAQATHVTPKWIDLIAEQLPRHFNASGYLGQVLPPGVFDEQQISGHGWLLRGLCELHGWRKDPRTKGHIEQIVRALLRPARGYYRAYPRKPEERHFEGAAIGSLDRKRSAHWYSSSDIGCAFIAFDGAAQAYALLGDPELAQLLDEMSEEFTTLDFRGISCQTHATLSGLRGLLRYYEATGRPELLDAALRVWNLYLEEGITANYANCNWFGRPLWTEPCAIVDSFMLGMAFWRLTGDPHHLTVAHGAFHSGLLPAQLPNGGFICHSCAGPGSDFLEPNLDVYEAWWCCNMRAGEGLSRAIEWACVHDDDTVVFPFYCDGTYRVAFPDGGILFSLRTEYPYSGDVLLEVLDVSVSTPKAVRLFVPRFERPTEFRVTVDGQPVFAELADSFVTLMLPEHAGTRIHLHFAMDVRAGIPNNIHSPKGCHVFHHGPLVLGYPAPDRDAPLVRIPRGAALTSQGNAIYTVDGTDITLMPLHDTFHMSEAAVKRDRRQVLFRE